MNSFKQAIPHPPAPDTISAPPEYQTEILLDEKELGEQPHDIPFLSVLALGVFIVLILNSFFRKTIALNLSSFLHFKHLRNSFQEKNIVVLYGSILQDTLYFLITGALLYKVALFYNFGNWNHLLLLIFCTAFVLSFYLLRILLAYAAAYIFEEVPIASFYAYNLFVSNRTITILLLPLSFLLLLKEVDFTYFLFILLALFALKWLFTLIRGVRILLLNKVSWYYSFLYLCTLEILPAYCFYKVVLVSFIY